MYFKLKLHERNGQALSITDSTEVSFSADTYRDFLMRTVKEKLVGRARGRAIAHISYRLGFPKGVRERIRAAGHTLCSKEAYAIVLGARTRVYAQTEQGFIYATSTLHQLIDHGLLEGGFLYDAPLADMRGYRVYLPSREGMGAFFAMLDLLAYYKYNCIMLEIGGAMEYKRHPEINDRWAAFCREVHAYSGRSKEIQSQMYPWHKNSIHCDNAEGDILTQEECRLIAQECRRRGLEPIPECPTHSHCDYLVMAHPELREREGDEYPDTYCPRHPDTYGYVFDILEEVIDVFRPARINIGHDEMYSIGVCPRCKGTPAHVLYADDIHRINDFLNAKGVQTMMWGEKLLKSFNNEGYPVGGMGHGTGSWRVPALYPCRDLVPKNIVYLHWYWAFNHRYDRVYHDRGLKVVYGNLDALRVKHWGLRRDWGIRGGFVSNWGSFREDYMQRNQQYISLITTAYAFWCEDFGTCTQAVNFERSAAEAYRLKCAGIRYPLRITHTTEYEAPYQSFYDGIFIVEEDDRLGSYELTCTDGTTYTLPVTYGTNIGSSDFEDALHQGAFKQLTYGTLPKRFGNGYAYEAVYENPAPDKAIEAIHYVPAPGKEHIRVELLQVCVDKSLRGLYDTRTLRHEENEFAMDGE